MSYGICAARVHKENRVYSLDATYNRAKYRRNFIVWCSFLFYSIFSSHFQFINVIVILSNLFKAMIQPNSTTKKTSELFGSVISVRNNNWSHKRVLLFSMLEFSQTHFLGKRREKKDLTARNPWIFTLINVIDSLTWNIEKEKIKEKKKIQLLKSIK